MRHRRPTRPRTADGLDDHGRLRDADRTRARILKAATDLFMHVGPSGASLDDISRKAGVARGLIYHYFKTKEQLFEQVLARPLADLLEQHLAFLEARRLDVDGLCKGAEEFFRFLGRHVELVRLIGWTMAMRRSGDIAKLEVTRALFSRMVRRIEDAKADGLLRTDLDARHLLVTILDLSIAWHLGRDEWCSKLAWVDRDVRELDEERLASILDVIRRVASPTPVVPPSRSEGETP
jgi:AcrR family transcriptional regulator